MVTTVSLPVPRPAASLIVLRDGPAGPEVLMLRRAARPGDQNSEAVVFPGGVVGPEDRRGHALCHGLSDEAASQRLALPAHGLDYWVAAIRECFEECGLLFAAPHAAAIGTDAPVAPAELLTRLRRALHAQRSDLAAVCGELGIVLDAGALAYHSHWITPAGLPKIFDTRFFIARAPQGQVATADGQEIDDAFWITPQAALSQGLKLMNVTSVTLQDLARHASVDDALWAARAQGHVPTIRPRLARTAKGRLPINPSHPAFAEVGRLDPEGRGDAAAHLSPGQPVWLSPRVLRVTAPNASMMTGPGTNSYFVGTPGAEEWALLDPGPADDAHLATLKATAPGRVTRVLVTHTHRDHSPAAAALAAHFGARRGGRLADHAQGQDDTFAPDDVLEDGAVIRLGADATLRVLHTPGHASNHLCFLLEQEQLLFTGDHLMQGSTVVINPPDGDMAAYLASLRRLLDEDLVWLAPGHGFLVAQPHDAVRRLIDHRLAREALVTRALQSIGPATPAQLRDAVYADTPPALHALALRSLQAHLLKLQGDGVAVQLPDGCWRLAA